MSPTFTAEEGFAILICVGFVVILSLACTICACLSESRESRIEPLQDGSKPHRITAENALPKNGDKNGT